MRFELDGSEIGEVAKLAKRLEEEFKGAPTQWKKLTDSVGLLSRALQDAGVNFYGRDEQQRARFREAVGRSMKDLKDVEKILEDAAFVLKSFDGNRRQWCPGWGRPKYSRTQVQQVVVQVAATAMMIRELIAETSSATPESDTPHDQQHQINHSRRMILDWLSPNDYASEHVDVVNRTHRDTARNIMISEKFTTWMTEEGRTIFCPGVSGAGKTIAAASVIEELKRRHQDNATVAVTYIYCNYHREESQTVQGLFESLLRQLVNGLPTLPSSVHSLYERYHQGQFRPRLDEVIHCVHEVATMYSRVFVVVDALDECSDNSGNECKRHSGDQTRLLSEMFQLQAQCLVNFFATSRPMANTLETFRQYPSLEIRAGEQDVRKYLDAHMSKLPPFVIQSPELRDQIKDRILQAMDGSFLLATLHLESLTNEQCPETLLQALTDLPTGPQAYTQVYEDLMRRIQTQSINRSNLAIDALHWLAHARRPLKVTELQHALAVELDSTELDHDRITPVKDIVSVCCGLVVVDEQSKVIRLVNRTAYEYFASLPYPRFQLAHAYIGKVCAAYLSLQVFQSGECYPSQLCERFQANPLFEYASHYWDEHARRGGVRDSKTIKDFTESAKAFEASCQGFCASLHDNSHLVFRFPEGFTPLHLSAYYGLSYESYHRKTRVETHIRDAFNRTPLFYAVMGGNGPCLSHLLRTQRDTDIVDKMGQTPLHLLINNGSLSILHDLLENGHGHINHKDLWGSTPLTLAAINGQERVCRELLGVGGDWRDTPCMLDTESLVWAGRAGHEEVVKLVLEATKADADYTDSRGTTTLGLAARCGHSEVVEFLIRANRVDVNSKDRCVATSLALAARHGHYQVVKLLLNLPGVRSNVKDRHNSTPLALAAEGGHTQIVKMLLKANGTRVNSRDKNGMTPLALAAVGGHAEVVKLLLQAPRIDADAPCRVGMSPLMLAARMGHVNVFKLLLATGAVKLDRECHRSMSAASWAASGGHEEILRLILETPDFDIDSMGSTSHTLLCHAAQNGHKDIALLLLDEYHVDVDAKGACDGRTPISYAAENGHTEVVQLLLDYQAEPDSKNTQDFNAGRTPLSYAANHGYADTVRLLLSCAGVDPDSKVTGYYNTGQTPLCFAATYGFRDSVRLLLETGKVDVNSRADPYDDNDTRIQTPLWFATSSSGGSLRQALSDEEYFTLWKQQAGFVLSKVETVELLLDHGASLEGIETWEQMAVDYDKLRDIIGKIKTKASKASSWHVT